MLQPHIRSFFDTYFCCSLANANDKTLIDDGEYVLKPVRVGDSILLCGKRNSAFPFHLMVGPDWPIVVLVYFLIVAIDTIVLGVISPLGWPPVLIGIVGAVLLLFAYSFVACSDPGIVYRPRLTESESQVSDLEESIVKDSTERNGQLMQRIPDTVECGHCQFKRPYSARHCHYCKVCIDDLDHHCPWCGKCIGKKNLKAFHLFVNVLCFQFYYLMGTLIYYFIATYTSTNVPTGPSF